MTLRQDIWFIENNKSCKMELCKKYAKDSLTKDCLSCRVNRIIDAINNVVSMMPKEIIVANTFVDIFSHNQGATGQYNKCQIYLRNEMKTGEKTINAKS